MTNLKKLFEQATARPWHNGTGRWSILGHSKAGRKGICIMHNTHDEQEAEANRRLITLAANHFEALVKALENCVQVMCESGPSAFDEELGQMWIAVAKQARSVLAAIEKDAR